jgi:hypothetical protein
MPDKPKTAGKEFAFAAFDGRRHGQVIVLAYVGSAAKRVAGVEILPTSGISLETVIPLLLPGAAFPNTTARHQRTRGRPIIRKWPGKKHELP